LNADIQRPVVNVKTALMAGPGFDKVWSLMARIRRVLSIYRLAII
jgi:hypothetical protein